MGTKPMVFPLDADGSVYVLHNENDEPVCTGSRQTCYKLMELMLDAKRRADELEMRRAASAQLEESALVATAAT